MSEMGVWGDGRLFEKNDYQSVREINGYAYRRLGRAAKVKAGRNL